ncbi:MAG: hypothetical protein AAF773_02440 [Cyanobacteria bacterium P01_D01_bin.115]
MPFSELGSFGVDEFTPELLPFLLQIEMSEIFLFKKAAMVTLEQAAK